jgi:hypothetical protein
MTDTRKTQPAAQEPAAKNHLQDGENPRNVPEHDLGETPPQPEAPEQSEKEMQQDQEPLRPGPLLRGEIPAGQHREIKNG